MENDVVGDTIVEVFEEDNFNASRILKNILGKEIE